MRSDDALRLTEGMRIISKMTAFWAQAKSIAVMLLQITLLLVQWSVAVVYIISALLMWDPFTHAPITSKLGWFMLVITPFVSMFALGSRSMRQSVGTVLISALTFMQLALMLVLIIYS